MKLFICQYCGKETKNPGANKAHENKCHSNPNPITYKNSSKPHNPANQFTKAKKLGLPKPEISESTREKIRNSNRRRKHSQESKDKISRARRKYLAENPDMVPYKLNHYSKGPSYPEKYWKKIFDEARLNYVDQYQIHTYHLDFALIEEKIDIEIDGEQHYLDKRIIESDKRRNQYLENLGWKIIRIRWSDYQKLVDKQDRKDYIDSIMKKIRTGTQLDMKILEIQKRYNYKKWEGRLTFAKNYNERQKPIIQELLDSNIDFSKFGWVTLASKIIISNFKPNVN